MSGAPAPDARSLPEDGSLPFDLRDELTRARLEHAVAHLHDVDVVSFDSEWWDGQAHAPCLVVRGGRRHRLLRVVEAGGDAVVLPFDRRAAQRWLSDLRRPKRVELGIPAQRVPGDIVVDATTDVVRCPGDSCGALLPVGYVEDCPVCGGAAVDAPGFNDEKSTATGARTAGSSISK
jgi:hypothetical protein